MVVGHFRVINDTDFQQVTPDAKSKTHFVLIDCGKPSTPVYDKLLRMGVIVRPMAAWGLPNCIRVSVPAHPDLPRVIGALEEVLA